MATKKIWDQAKQADRLGSQVYTMGVAFREWVAESPAIRSEKINRQHSYGKGTSVEQHLKDAQESLFKAHAQMLEHMTDDSIKWNRDQDREAKKLGIKRTW